MAEWAPPTPPPPAPPPPPPPPPPAGDPDPPIPPATYVVQVPKDQIYRVPPPENARIVQKYRENLDNHRRRQSPCASLLLWALLAITIIAALLLVLALVFYIIVRPGTPSFAVEQFIVKDSPRSEYDVVLKSRNPSAMMGFVCESGGESVISNRNKDVATGETPGFHLGNHDAIVVKLVLHGSKGSLKWTKAILPLVLSAKFPTALTVGGMTVWTASMEVECDVRVSMLAKRTRVASQECEVKVRW